MSNETLSPSATHPATSTEVSLDVLSAYADPQPSAAFVAHLTGEAGGKGGGGISEAPVDGAQYVRQNGAWVAIKPPPQPFGPVLDSITPNSLPAGSPDTIVTFTGSGFVNQEMQPCFGDQLMSWYQQMAGPHFISATQFQATLGANLLANPTTFFLWLQNTGGPDSNNLEFDVV